MKVKTKLKRLLSLALSYVLVLGLMPFEPTVVQAANATTLYITDAASGTVQTVTTDTTDSEGGWSYNAATATLTLNGFNGAYIEANGDLNIVLNGTNTITVASDSGYGIKVDGKLTIDDTTSPSDDSLNVICNEPKADAHMITTGSGDDTYNNGGTVSLNGITTDKSIIGFDRSLYVNHDANLDIGLSAGENIIYMVGADAGLYQYTSGVVSVSVDSQDSYSYLICNLYQRGTGDINLTAKGKTKAIYGSGSFVQSSGATGTVTVKGYLNSFNPQNNTCKVVDHDNVIWSYYTSNPEGTSSSFLCDSNGNPIKDPVIKYVASQSLTVMDSPLFDIPEKKVGEKFGNTLNWKEGCKGGTGDYTFSLAEDSAPLPDGLSIESYGCISGAPTEAHAAGEVKIKVVSGEETAYFTIHYGEITYNNPVTSMELDKTETTINKGEAVDLTATIYPTNADKRNVKWSCSNTLGKLEELSCDESSNTRTARFTAGDKAGTLNITAAALIGGFSKQCTVYIKEAKPTASAGNVYIEGLEAGGAYTVNGTAYTADAAGKIEIDDSWRETTVSIVRTNEEPKCNSDAQELKVGKYTAIDVNTLSDKVTVEYSSATYDGNEKKPQVTITGLTQDTDYTVSYENNVNAGKATVNITGISDYCGTLYQYFTIEKASIEDFEFTLSDTEYTYDKTEKKPAVSVTGLVKDTDYTVAYKDNTAAGTATVTITGKGNYQGTVTKNFTINHVSIEGKEVHISVSEYEYDGTAKTPVIAIPGLTKDVDYTVEYADNILAGTAKAVVTGIGNYTGSVVKTFTIKGNGETPHSHTFDQKIMQAAALKTAADCTNNAVYYKSCSCGVISTADADTFTAAGTAQGHSWPTAGGWSKNADKHWYECSRCHEKKEEAAHTAGDWIVDQEATATAVGSKHKACSVCGYTLETAQIPATGNVPAAEGELIADEQGSSYKVTKSDAKVGEVTFAMPKSGVKGTVKVPDTVTIGGITYQVTAIEAGAFKNNKKITKVTVGKHVTVIDKNAFSGCTKLKAIKLAAATTTIADKAFYKCSSLTSITIPSKVTKIGKSAFEGCKKLKTITVKTTKLKSVGKRAFKGIHAKAKIKVPKSKLAKYKSLFKNKGQGKSVKITK